MSLSDYPYALYPRPVAGTGAASSLSQNRSTTTDNADMPGHTHGASNGERRTTSLPPLTPMVSLRHLNDATSKINALSQQVQDLTTKDRERQMHQTFNQGLNPSALALFNGPGDMMVPKGNLSLNPSGMAFPSLGSQTPFNSGLPDLSRYVDASAGVAGGWTDADAYRRYQLAQLGGMSGMGGMPGHMFNSAMSPWSTGMGGMAKFDHDSRYHRYSSSGRTRSEHAKAEVMVVTTDHVPGFRIVEARGRLMAALNQHEIKQIREWVEKAAPLEAMRTGQVARYVRQHVHDQVVMQAMHRGCNAIVDFQFDSEVHTDSSGNTACTGLSARGLAVVVKATISDKEKKREKRKTIEGLRKVQEKVEHKEYLRKLKRELNALDPKERKERMKELHEAHKAKNKKEPTHKELMAQLMDLLDEKDKKSRKTAKGKGKARGVRFADRDKGGDASDEDSSSSGSSSSDDDRAKGKRGYGVDSDTDLDALLDGLAGKSGSGRGAAGWDPSKARTRKNSGGSRSSRSRRGSRSKDEDFIKSLFTKSPKSKKKAYYDSSDSESSSSSSSSEDFPMLPNSSRNGSFKWGG